MFIAIEEAAAYQQEIRIREILIKDFHKWYASTAANEEGFAVIEQRLPINIKIIPG